MCLVPLIIRVSFDPGDLALLLVLQHVEGEGVVPHHQVPAAVATATPGRISTGVRDFARALDISRCSKYMFKMSNLMQKWNVNISLVVCLVYLHHFKHTKNIFTDF